MLHTGPQPWTTARTFAELLRGPEAIRAFGPKWEPLFWSLTDRTADELLAGGDWQHFLAVMRVAHADRDELDRVVRAACRRLGDRQSPDRVRALELLRAALTFVLSRRDDVDVAALRAIVQEEHGPEEEVAIMGRTLVDKGGWIVGRRMVLAVLTKRFGTIPSEVSRKVEALEDADELARLHDRAMDVTSPEQLFEPPAAS